MNVRVLILEDDPIQARYASATLSRCDFPDFAVVSDAQHALERLRAERWDVLLCDLLLPDMDGISLVHELTKLADPPQVIFTTTLDPRFLHAAELIAKSVAIDVIGLIEKPISMDAIRRILPGGIDSSSSSACIPSGSRDILVSYRAIEHAFEEGRFEPWFQPQVCCRTGDIVGVEALARLRDPRHGIQPPAAFMPAIMAKNLEGRLAATMLEQSLLAQQHWISQGLCVSVSINLSSTAMARRSVVRNLVNIADSLGARREDVVFELTETPADGATEGALFENLTFLRMAGFGLAIDDFGIGYSSLARLRDIPFTELKIDKSFLDGLSDHTHRRAIVESMIKLAHQLGMHTVAEGVETQAHSLVVRELGCDREQGYLHGAPMTEAQLLSFSRQNRSQKSLEFCASARPPNGLKSSGQLGL